MSVFAHGFWRVPCVWIDSIVRPLDCQEATPDNMGRQQLASAGEQRCERPNHATPTSPKERETRLSNETQRISPPTVPLSTLWYDHGEQTGFVAPH